MTSLSHIRPPLSVSTLRPLDRGRSDGGSATLPSTGPPSPTGFLWVRGVVVGLWGVFLALSGLERFRGCPLRVVWATKRVENGPFWAFLSHMLVP